MMKAIETAFDGHRFRSRLEARWAVFFKTLGIPYEYEKEGYQLDNMRYLPDFWLPHQKSFFEVKGDLAMADASWKKCERLVELSGYPLYIAVGEIKPWQWEQFQYTQIFGLRKKSDLREREPSGRLDYQQAGTADIVGGDCCWSECPYCGIFDLTFDFTAEDLPCGCFKQRMKDNPLQQGIKDRDYERLGYDECWFMSRVLELMYTGDSYRLKKAYTAARSARFEFGQKG